MTKDRTEHPRMTPPDSGTIEAIEARTLTPGAIVMMRVRGTDGRLWGVHVVYDESRHEVGRTVTL
jgi:hypothetical protein